MTQFDEHYHQPRITIRDPSLKPQCTALLKLNEQIIHTQRRYSLKHSISVSKADLKFCLVRALSRDDVESIRAVIIPSNSISEPTMLRRFSEQFHRRRLTSRLAQNTSRNPHSLHHFDFVNNLKTRATTKTQAPVLRYSSRPEQKKRLIKNGDRHTRILKAVINALCCLFIFLSFIATTAYVQYQCPSILSQMAPFAEEQQEEHNEISKKKDFTNSAQTTFANVTAQAIKLKERHLQQLYKDQFTSDIFKPPQFGFYTFNFQF